MLVELKVKNFAIIESLSLSFKSGLNILSGETGAGKSIILKSLALLMGEKALADTVRSGADSAVIEGCFDLTSRKDIQKSLEEMGIEIEDDSLIVRRVVSSQGKSKIYINGRLSALTNLRDVVCPLITVTGHTAPLIEMTGQHENRNLQSKTYHLEVLDQYSGCWTLRLEFEKGFHRLSEIETEIEKIQEAARSRDQRLDFLKYQRDEITGLDLQVGEEKVLEEKYHRIKHSARLTEFAQLAEGMIYSEDDSILVRLHQILQRASELTHLDPSLSKWTENLTQAKSLLEDSVYELRSYEKNLDADPKELEEVEARMSTLRRLQKKFGGDADDILKSLREIESEIESLELADSQLVSLQAEKEKIHLQLQNLGEDLHKRRKNGAKLLEKGVNEELLDLNMKGVTFVVRADQMDQWNSTGLSEVEFMIQASKKDEARSLAKVASGGELSRILLSLKRVVGHSNQPRTYLFDEVDTGVSGLTAEKVGRKLRSISEGQQVICVTHLPQVAAFADHHFLIEKSPSKNGVQMNVAPLKSADRVKEIARLISGEKISKTSLDHAKQLLSESTTN